MRRRRVGLNEELPHRQPADAASLRSPNAALPITPVFGRAGTAGFGVAESGIYGARFRQVFGRGLECPAGGADADAQPLGDDPPRGAGGSEAGYLARVDGDWLIAGAIGVYGYKFVERCLNQVNECVGLGSTGAHTMRPN